CTTARSTRRSPRSRARASWAKRNAMRHRMPRPPIGGTIILYNQIKRNLEHVCDFFQSCSCSLSPSAFQIGNVTLSDISLARDVELRFTAPLAKRAQRVLATGNSVNDFFRNERRARGNLFPCPRHQARSAKIFVGFQCLGGKGFVVLTRKDSDLAFVGHFKSDVHDAYLSVVNLSAVADGNDGNRSGVLDEDNAPITDSKPASVGALEPPYIARAVGRIDRQFGVDAVADIGRKLEPLTGCGRREGKRFHS